MSLAMTFLLAISTLSAWAGNKRLMSMMGAELDAQRKLVEAVYGLKIRASERVEDMVAAAFSATTESKTAAHIAGIEIEETVYDPERDIARATAVVRLDTLTNIDGEILNFNSREFRCVGFGTATPANAGPLKALRTAELDAYKQLAQQVVGFSLESRTRVENFQLAADVIKTRVLATVYLARITDFGWGEGGDAYVKMELNTAEAAEILGDAISGRGESIQIEGRGAQKDDFSESYASSGE
jgi:hypothetical protein